MVVVNSKSPGCNPRGGNSEQIQIHASLVEHGTSGIMNQRQNVGFPIFLCESPARGKATCCKAQPADFCVSFLPLSPYAHVPYAHSPYAHVPYAHVPHAHSPYGHVHAKVMYALPAARPQVLFWVYCLLSGQHLSCRKYR